jgi:hypothetical protein
MIYIERKREREREAILCECRYPALFAKALHELEAALVSAQVHLSSRHAYSIIIS